MAIENGRQFCVWVRRPILATTQKALTPYWPIRGLPNFPTLWKTVKQDDWYVFYFMSNSIPRSRCTEYLTALAEPHPDNKFIQSYPSTLTARSTCSRLSTILTDSSIMRQRTLTRWSVQPIYSCVTPGPSPRRLCDLERFIDLQSRAAPGVDFADIKFLSVKF